MQYYEFRGSINEEWERMGDPNPLYEPFGLDDSWEFYLAPPTEAFLSAINDAPRVLEFRLNYDGRTVWQGRKYVVPVRIEIGGDVDRHVYQALSKKS